MPNFSLLFARTLQDADDSALIDWHWDKVGELYHEYRRPDTGERARFVPDMADSLQNLRWNTKVYAGRGWDARRDHYLILGFIEAGFFKLTDPELPPPRPRLKRADALSEIRRTLTRLERQ